MLALTVAAAIFFKQAEMGSGEAYFDKFSRKPEMLTFSKSILLAFLF